MDEEWTCCPFCGAAWGQEEIDTQCCDACGWPDDDLDQDAADLDL